MITCMAIHSQMTGEKQELTRGGGGGGLFLARLSHLTILTIGDASLSRWSAVPTPSRDTSNCWAPITYC